MCGASMVHPLINIFFFSFDLFMFIEFLLNIMEFFCSFHGVTFICASFKIFMVVVFMVTTFIVYFFKVTCASFKFFTFTGIIFLYHMWHFACYKFHFS